MLQSMCWYVKGNSVSRGTSMLIWSFGLQDVCYTVSLVLHFLEYRGCYADPRQWKTAVTRWPTRNTHVQHSACVAH